MGGSSVRKASELRFGGCGWSMEKPVGAKNRRSRQILFSFPCWRFHSVCSILFNHLIYVCPGRVAPAKGGRDGSRWEPTRPLGAGPRYRVGSWTPILPIELRRIFWLG